MIKRQKKIPEYDCTLKEMSGDKALLTWDYQVIGLYNMEAEQFRHQQAFCMYSLLPAMKGVDASMLILTLQEMKQRYTTEEMKHHLDCFWKMLQKSITISQEDKLQVEKELKIQFDWFIDTVPEVIERVEQAEKRDEAKGEAKGLAEGEARGMLEEARLAVQDVVQARFPNLLPFVQVQVKLITQQAQLRQLRFDIMQASDQTTVINLLTAS